MELSDLSKRMIERERKNGTIDVEELAVVLYESQDNVKRREFLVGLVAADPVLNDPSRPYRSHSEAYEFGLKKAYAFVDLKKRHNITDARESSWMYDAIGEALPIDVHNSMFVPTLEGQLSPEQRAYWLPLAKTYRVIGTYAQTELGHGSNVQGLETTATYDKSTREFVVHSPTLTSRKWVSSRSASNWLVLKYVI